MDGTEFVLAVVAIACITSIIKSWINRGRETENIETEQFNRLAKAFLEHKKEMQQRIENLEAIIAGDENDTDETFSQIELENDGSSLTNDLQQKDRVRQ